MKEIEIGCPISTFWWCHYVQRDSINYSVSLTGKMQRSCEQLTHVEQPAKFSFGLQKQHITGQPEHVPGRLTIDPYLVMGVKPNVR